MHITTIKPEASESKKIISILPYGTVLHHHHFNVYIGSIDWLTIAIKRTFM